jgi:chemotaxis protein MotB
MLERAHARDRYNRPRIAPAVIDASSSIELELFEQVVATPGTALLRLAARAPDVDGARASTLVVDDGRTQHRLRPIPQPPDQSGLLRAAYTAPLQMLVGRVAFALELPDGSVLDLPSPTRSRRGRKRSGGPVAPAATARRQTVEARAQRAELQAAAIETILDEHQRAVTRAAELAAELERRASDSVTSPAMLENELASARRETEEAQRETEAIRAQLVELQAAALEANRTATTIQNEHDHAVARAAALGAELARRESDSLASLAAMQSRLTELVGQLSVASAARQAAEATAIRLEAELEETDAELEESGRRTAALTGQLAALRGAREQAEAVQERERAEAGAAAQALRDDQEAAHQTLRGTQAELRRAQGELAHASSEVQRLSEALHDAETEREHHAQHSLQERLTELEVKHARATAGAEATQQQLRDADVLHKRMSTQAEELATRLLAHNEVAAVLARSLAAAHDETERLRAQVEKLDSDHRKERAALTASRAELETTVGQRDRAEVELDHAEQGRQAALERISAAAESRARDLAMAEIDAAMRTRAPGSGR